MEINPSTAEIDMKPGDRLTLRVGMFRKCNIEVTANGTVRIYHGAGSLLEIK